MNPFNPPPEVRGMKLFDRHKFDSTVLVPAVRIEESAVSCAMKFIKKYLLKIDKFKPVQSENLDTKSSYSNSILAQEQSLTEEPSSRSMKIIYLNPLLVQSWADIDESDATKLEAWIRVDDFLMKEVTLSYDNWKHDEVFKAILPVDKDNLASFSTIGHILHVNLKDHLLEYKDVIGQVLLDKVKGCKTVVHKTNAIDNTFRNFSMEVLCGEPKFEVSVKENRCAFEFDFSQVYWNPRLCTEHERIVDMLKSGDTLFDVFAGVGPFAVPAAKKKCIVFANDLNPQSHKWLCHNAKLNKVEGDRFKPFNLDGRCFIRNVFATHLVDTFGKSEVLKGDIPDIHLTMNLPAMAVEFLDVFHELLKEKTLINFREPIVHVYCFVFGDSPTETAKQLVESHLGHNLGEHLINIFNVRNVSPKKEMMRVSFRMPLYILLGSKEKTVNNHVSNESDDYEPKNKLKKC